MSKDLTKSDIDRQNILNNPFAIEEIKKATNLRGIMFRGKLTLIKEQIAEFFEVTPRTIDNYLSKYESELKQNGYEILRGNALQEFKLAVKNQFGNEIDFVGKGLHNTNALGLFDFRAFLNLAMLIIESERAKLLRQAILDIVIDTINQKTGGGTKYINQRDEDFIISYFKEENYRKEFTDALRDFVDMGNFKYPAYTNKIYLSIFRENAQEYRKILRLKESDEVRDTFYSEIIKLVSSYEYGFANKLEEAYKKIGRKLTAWEVDNLFAEFESQPLWKPLVEDARNKMASRDLAFRDAMHIRLQNYLTPLDTADFERFLGEKSKELIERLEESKEIFKRLKGRE
jgi:hypothetical protein